MLRSMKALMDYGLLATDGKIGAVDDFLFDDHAWTVRYLVANTGGWLRGRLVLISPAAMERPDWQSRLFPVDLTRDQIEQSPSILSDAPVARQKELELARHYNWPMYWAIDSLGGFGAAPIVTSIEPPQGQARPAEEEGNPHLRSVREVRGYRIHATDGDIGHVDDFIVDDANWAIRYLVVDTRNWLPGRKVLLACDWIEEVSWPDTRVAVCHSREEIKNSPEYDPSAPVNRQYEDVLHDYYGRPKYWERGKQPDRSGKSGEKRR
jgi:uncharacterized protein YrrD